MRMPTIYLAHGGGPMPLLGMDDACRAHLESIRELVPEKPKAIVVVSAHWESNPISVTSHASPDLLFDYYGFPPESYKYKYEAPGSPELSRRVQELLAGFGCSADAKRGWDHGVFVPLLLAYPDADIPVVELSLHASLDPETHLNVGKALAPLRDEGVLILASGMSFHNMRAFSKGSQKGVGQSFDDDLYTIVRLDSKERYQKLKSWTTSLREARFSHPREEHFLPLLVAAGAADHDDKSHRIFNDNILGARVSAFAFGNIVLILPLKTV